MATPDLTPSVAHRSAARRTITIEDVAREAGVAKSTVSRALNNPGRLAPDTQRHIREVANRLGYQPNAVARALGTRRTDTIALLVPDMSNPFFSGIIRGAEHEASSSGRNLILIDFHEDPDFEAEQVRRLTGSVDGFILGASRLDSGHIQQLAANQPIVTLNRPVRTLPGVIIDPTAGANSAMEHLASLSHQHISYISGPSASWANRRRWAALSAAAKAKKIRVSRLGPFVGARQSGPAAADAVIAAGATAAVAFNDLIAIGMLGRFAERGVSVPADVSVLGFDDIFGADFCSPGLTTLAAPLEELGRTAVRILPDHQSAAGAVERHIVLAAALVVRASTGTRALKASGALPPVAERFRSSM